MSRRTTRIIAAEGGIAAGRDVTLGATVEQVQELVARATAPLKSLNREQLAQIQDLSVRLGVSEGIVRAALAALHENVGSFTPADLPAKVAGLVEERRRLLARLAEGEPEADNVLADIDHALAAAIDAGDDQSTQALLVRRRDLKGAAAAQRAKQIERLRAAEDLALRDAAEAEANLGDFAFARLRYRDAVAHFSAAEELLPPDAAHRDQRLTYRNRAIDALYHHGLDFGDNAALLLAIAALRATLAEWPIGDMPLDWAATLNNLGNALLLLGMREGSRTRLEEAVVAYAAAVGGRTRSEAPLDWATIQNNLGVARLALGELDGDPVRLKEARDAFCAALEERSQRKAPMEWAITLNNLGNALRALGELEGSMAWLKDGIVAQRAARRKLTRDCAPLRWAMAQNNIGVALAILGALERSTARLEKAVAAFNHALLERTRPRVPLEWAMTQNNLAGAHLELGRLERDTARLEKAVAACHSALEVRTRECVPLDWAQTKLNLGNALRELGEREERDTAWVAKAIAAYRAALKVYDPKLMPIAWAGAMGGRGVAYRLLADRTSDLPMARRARDQIAAADEAMRGVGRLYTFYAIELTKAEALVTRLAA